jgi:hypothetical protein
MRSVKAGTPALAALGAAAALMGGCGEENTEAAVDGVRAGTYRADLGAP